MFVPENNLELATSILLLAALPEEWYFRGYLMKRLEMIQHSPHLSNLTTSALFTLLHLPAQGWFGLSIFIPSLFYGWVFQKTNDLISVILLHTLSNLVFVLHFKQLLL